MRNRTLDEMVSSDGWWGTALGILTGCILLGLAFLLFHFL